MTETCIRCGREVDTEAPLGEWEAEIDEDGEVIGTICENCVTSEERQAVDEDDMAFGDAMQTAFPDDVDPEVIGETENRMREDLAQSLYEHERDDGP